MIIVNTFDFEGLPLRLSSHTKISADILEDIEDLIRFFSSNLNKNSRTSALYLFNKSPENFPVITEQFLERYLKENIYYQNIFEFFRPFSEKITVNDLFYSNSEKTIIKFKQVELIKSTLKVTFILESIRELLLSNSVNHFLLEFKNMCIANGFNEWSFTLNINKQLVLKNESFIFTEIENSYKESTFGVSTDVVEYNYAAISGKNLNYILLLCDFLIQKNLRFRFELRKFTSDWNVNLHLFDSEFNTVSYSK